MKKLKLMLIVLILAGILISPILSTAELNSDERFKTVSNFEAFFSNLFAVATEKPSIVAKNSILLNVQKTAKVSCSSAELDAFVTNPNGTEIKKDAAITNPSIKLCAASPYKSK